MSRSMKMVRYASGSSSIVRYLRHLPAAGSLGLPDVYREEEEQHEHMRGGEEKDKHH
jgi:hypothetical protein